MALTVTDRLVDRGEDLYYDPAFRRMIEVHLNILRRHRDNRYLSVQPDLVHQYEGDLFGLLGSNEFGIEFRYRWIIMRVNYLTANHQFGQSLEDPYRGGDDVVLTLPPEGLMEELVMRYLTTGQ